MLRSNDDIELRAVETPNTLVVRSQRGEPFRVWSFRPPFLALETTTKSIPWTVRHQGRGVEAQLSPSVQQLVPMTTSVSGQPPFGFATG
jgi:hypothetical protein